MVCMPRSDRCIPFIHGCSLRGCKIMEGGEEVPCFGASSFAIPRLWTRDRLFACGSRISSSSDCHSGDCCADLAYHYSEIEYHLLKISKCWWGGRCCWCCRPCWCCSSSCSASAS